MIKRLFNRKKTPPPPPSTEGQEEIVVPLEAQPVPDDEYQPGEDPAVLFEQARIAHAHRQMGASPRLAYHLGKALALPDPKRMGKPVVGPRHYADGLNRETRRRMKRKQKNARPNPA